ncbi:MULTISPECIES: DUF2786 domain-containing protein [Roseomonadaceae]|uniref:DUF2786 domain-containing protein n=1 Tax=Falsiroseomonas oleicola TaxID=2801474 RepID=A0ABS6H901_9PROT|nr:DUF2786 domain-containing protein [Roseomonas oleicola]MBU8544193.1 DUF2786 domain-containing protein [Roseomonas oleicola]
MKARLRALAAKTIDRGCSEAEAMMAAQKVGELLEVYGLTMSEVELRDEPCLQRDIVITGPRLQAVGIIFMAILRLTETRGWMVGRNHFVLFGLEPDVLMGEYLMHVVAGAVDHEEALFRASEAYRRSRQTPQQRLRSFRYGFAERVSERMDELAAQRQASMTTPAASGGGTALVVAKEKRVAEAFRDLGIRLRSRTTTRRVSDNAAFRQGAAAGGRVALERPVGAGAGTPRLPGRRGG